MTGGGSARPAPRLQDLVAVPNFVGVRPTTAKAVTGVTPLGESVVHELVEAWTLLLFLSTSCEGCLDLWDEVLRERARLPAEVTLLVVTHGSGEDMGQVAERARRATVIMSEEAWGDYRVHSGPFFVLTDGRTRVRSEGVAWSFDQVFSAVAEAMAASG